MFFANSIKNKIFEKICLVIFGRFSIISDIFDLCILKFVFKRSIFLQRKILEARFWTPNSYLYSSFFQRFDQNFELSNSRSNVRNKNWSLGSKSRLPEFFVEAKWIFWIRTLICRGQKYQMLSKNGRKWPKIFFKKF